MKPFSLVLTLVGCVLWSACPLPAAEAELPVTKITAFSSGVSYYEHNGDVTGDADVLLKFKTDQINDILKSLVVLDKDGTVTGVSYGSRDPLARALKSFGIDISGEPTMGQLLRQVRGAEVTVEAAKSLKGKVLNVEARTEHILPGDKLVTKEYLDLLTAEGMKQIPLDSIGSIALTDQKLGDELNKALALLVESRDTNTKPVQIQFTGKGKRPVSIGYVAEAPIWKTSYRLIANADGKKDQFKMQGWAIVENTSDFDWDKVALTLVSGRPISFIQDLYTPLYVPRPVVQPELYASLRPQTYDEGIEGKDKELAELKAAPREDARLRRSGAMGVPGAPPAGAMAAPAAKAADGRAFGDDLANQNQAEKAKADREALYRGVQSVAQATEVGEMTSYVIKTPVTIQRRKSAMLPIVNADVEGKKVSIYNAAVLAKNPLSGLWLINTTGVSLLAGPVTVFDEGTYAGDARIDNLSPNDKRLLSYAIDLRMTIDPTAATISKIASVTFARGIMTINRRDEYTQTYVIKNKAEQERHLVIEHPRIANRKLVSPKEPEEKTPGLYRFDVNAPAAKKTDASESKFVVIEEYTYGQGIYILPADVGALQLYISNAEIPQKVKDVLAEAVKRKSELTLEQRKLVVLEQDRVRMTQDQARTVANMQPLDKTTDAYKTFEKKLVETEKKIEDLDTQIAAQKAKVQTLQNALEEYLMGVKIE